MRKFDSYHWQNAVLDDPDLQAARNRLGRSPGGEEGVRSFLTLLRSSEEAARGIALDYYHYAASQERYGSPNPFSGFRSEVLEAARNILRAPARPARESGGDFDGAEHASALVALANEATEQDSGLVVDALRKASSFDTVSAALQAAGRIMRWSDPPPDNLVSSILLIVHDEDLDLDERLEALQALARGKTPETLRELARVAEFRDPVLQVTATHALAFHDLETYRSFVEERFASWPDDSPYPASEVRDLLSSE